MRWETTYSKESWKRRWHVWYAWRPIIAQADKEHKKVWVWLEEVRRKRFSSWDGYYYEYSIMELKLEEGKYD